MSVASAKLRALPVVATIGGGAVRVAGRDADAAFAGPHYPSVEALLTATETADAVVVPTRDGAVRDAALAQLRADPRYALTPLLVTASAPLAPTSLADGDCAIPELAYRTIADIRERTLALPNESLQDPEARLLGFLYSRPNKTIAPLADWRTERCYRFPLIEAFDPQGLAGHEWLATLVRRQLLEPAQLIDRIRTCPSCRGAHCNYVDLCASCGHLDIVETIFLHCYTCGHVAQQDGFVDAQGLGCRKCHARLRHIGVDYDRALETFSCRACNARFAEPDIQARCWHCQAQNATTDLVETPIHSYRLSAAGQLAARTGNVGDLFSLLDGANGAHPAYFERTLDWLLAVSIRHAEVQFGVLCIRLENLRELIDRASRGQAAKLMDAFAMRLRELVRTTDIVMRSDERHCWLLLPQTPPAGLAVLKQRIEALPSAASQGDHRLSIRVAALASAELGDRRVNAKALMAEMHGALG
jgi:GGDEF domain-containing protein